MTKFDLRHEFIGREVKAVNSGIEGKVIDETKNSFLVKTKNDMKKRLLKQNSLFEFRSESGITVIDGNLILMRPEDRIKIKTKPQKSGGF